MKKKLLYISVAFASIMSYAQQGNVGVNTVDPKATVDITKKSANTTNDVEGLLIPRVSKNKAYQMGTNVNLQESTMIYVNSISDYTTSPVDATVADITENGYYFWNAAKWVKVTGRQGEIWKKITDGKVNLEDTDTKDSVFYKKNGGYVLTPKQKIETTSWRSGTWPPGSSPGYLTTTVADQNKGYSTSYITKKGYASNIEAKLNPNQVLNYTNGEFKSTSLIVDNDAKQFSRGFVTNTNNLSVPAENKNDYKILYANVNSATHTGKGKIHNVMGEYNVGIVGSPDSQATYVRGVYNQATTYSSKPVGVMEASYNFLTPRGEGDINLATVNANHAQLRGAFKSTINSLTLNRNYFQIDTGADVPSGGVINNLYGTYTSFTVPQDNTVDIKNQYGIYLSNVDKGTDSNYSIYTTKGSVRFGDMPLSTVATDKIVVADADGVLKTKDAASLVSSNAEWKYDATTKQVDLVRSGTAPFKNKVYYDEKGNSYNINKDSYKYVSFSNFINGTIETVDYNIGNGFFSNVYQRNSSNLKAHDIKIGAAQYEVKKMKTNVLSIDNSDQSDRFTGVDNVTILEPDFTQDKYFAIGSEGRVINSSQNNNIRFAAGSNGSSSISNSSSSTGYIWGSRGYANSITSGSVNSISSFGGYTYSGGTGTINKMSSLHGTIQIGVGSNQINDVSVVRASSTFYGNNKATIDSFKAFNYEGVNLLAPTANVSIKSQYGLYLNDVDRGTDSNYSIYTNDGLVRLGDYLRLGNNLGDKHYAQLGRGFSNGAGLSLKAVSTTTATELPLNFIDFDFQNTSGDNTQGGIVRLYRATNLTGRKALLLHKGDGTEEVVTRFGIGEDSYIANEVGMNVGIGTSTPTEKLHVAGNVKADSFISTSGSTFPDYVFENYYNGESALKPTYNFKSLDQVESFIKAEGHLPGYKSAKEVKQAGQIDMTATQLTNVEKIEELYLHTIEQQKELKSKDAKIKELEARLARLEKMLLTK